MSLMKCVCTPLTSFIEQRVQGVRPACSLVHGGVHGGVRPACALVHGLFLMVEARPGKRPAYRRGLARIYCILMIYSIKKVLHDNFY